jgi:hypothetical protein
VKKEGLVVGQRILGLDQQKQTKVESQGCTSAVKGSSSTSVGLEMKIERPVGADWEELCKKSNICIWNSAKDLNKLCNQQPEGSNKSYHR